MLQNLKNAGQAVSGANKMRQQQAKLQKLLQEIRVTGTSKNGKVTVIITGEQKIIEINVDPSLIKFVYQSFLDIEDQDKQEEMATRGNKFITTPIIEAFEQAIEKVQAEVVKKMQETGSIGDLMSMLQSAGGAGNQ